MTISYTTTEDARTALINDGLYEAVNPIHDDDVAEYMWRNNATVEDALNANPEWTEEFMNNEELKTLGEKFIELSGMFLAFIERNGLDETIVDMSKANDTRKEEAPLCKTPLCHGGWLAVMFEQENMMQHVDKHWFYEKGAEQVAEFLGFAGEDDLVDWAGNNIKIWDNVFGDCMFTDKDAFRAASDVDDLTLTGIANHYAAVGKRCIAKSQSDASSGGQS